MEIGNKKELFYKIVNSYGHTTYFKSPELAEQYLNEKKFASFADKGWLYKARCEPITFEYYDYVPQDICVFRIGYDCRRNELYSKEIYQR